MQYVAPSEDFIDQEPTKTIEETIDPAQLENFRRMMSMRGRVSKHTIARRERAKSRISKRKNKR